MVEVRNNGVPLIEHAPKSTIAQSIQKLSDALSGKEPQNYIDQEGKGRRWLHLWPSR